MPGWALLLSLLGTATADVLDDFSFEQMLAYVPRQTPTFCLNFAHSPAIDYAEAPNIVQQAGKGRVEWTWDAASPDSITDTISGTTFPNNETETVQRPMTSAAGLATSVTYFKARTPAHIKNNYMRTTNRADAPPRRYYYSMYEDALYLGGCIAAQQLDYLRSEPRRAHSCGPAAESNRPPWALRKSCGALRLTAALGLATGGPHSYPRQRAGRPKRRLLGGPLLHRGSLGGRVQRIGPLCLSPRPPPPTGRRASRNSSSTPSRPREVGRPPRWWPQPRRVRCSLRGCEQIYAHSCRLAPPLWNVGLVGYGDAA